MNLFDTCIEKCNAILEGKCFRELPLTDQLLEDVGNNNFIFDSDMAYELGGEVSLSFELSTTNEAFLQEDKILLLGPDLQEVKEDQCFQRITLIKTKESIGSDNHLFDNLQKLKFVKYHVSPKGYMLRTATQDKEKVRIDKNLAKTASFSEIGSAYIKEYKKLPFVEHVAIFFLVGQKDLQKELKAVCTHKNEIASAIDHISKGMVLNDCSVCDVKSLCDEVQGMRELHQKS